MYFLCAERFETGQVFTPPPPGGLVAETNSYTLFPFFLSFLLADITGGGAWPPCATSISVARGGGCNCPPPHNAFSEFCR